MKTRLFTRKRALISSVAMLLVAMIALGTATFAWFTKSTTTSATGIQVKTQKSSELKISKSDHSWTDQTINYSVDTTLKPASTADGESWYQANALAKNAKAADTTTVAAAEGSYVFKEQLNVMNAAATGSKNMKVTITISGLSCAYGRLAVVPATDGTVTDGVSAAKADAVFNDCVYDTDGESVYPWTSTSAQSTTKQTGKTARTIVIDSLAPNTAEYFNIYVWFDGEDEQCFDTNAGVAVGNITFSVSGETID